MTSKNSPTKNFRIEFFVNIFDIELDFSAEQKKRFGMVCIAAYIYIYAWIVKCLKMGWKLMDMGEKSMEICENVMLMNGNVWKK